MAVWRTSASRIDGAADELTIKNPRLSRGFSLQRFEISKQTLLFGLAFGFFVQPATSFSSSAGGTLPACSSMAWNCAGTNFLPSFLAYLARTFSTASSPVIKLTASPGRAETPFNRLSASSWLNPFSATRKLIASVYEYCLLCRRASARAAAARRYSVQAKNSSSSSVTIYPRSLASRWA